MIKSRILTKKGASEQRHEEKKVDSSVKEGRFQKDDGGQAKRASLEVKGSSMSR